MIFLLFLGMCCCAQEEIAATELAVAWWWNTFVDFNVESQGREENAQDGRRRWHLA